MDTHAVIAEVRQLVSTAADATDSAMLVLDDQHSEHATLRLALSTGRMLGCCLDCLSIGVQTIAADLEGVADALTINEALSYRTPATFTYVRVPDSHMYLCLTTLLLPEDLSDRPDPAFLVTRVLVSIMDWIAHYDGSNGEDS